MMLSTFLFCLVSALPMPLQDLQKKFRHVQSFSASFTQEVPQKLFPGSPETAEGNIAFKKPGWIQWSYSKPEKRVLTYEKREIVVEEDGTKETIATSGPVTFEESFSFLWGQPDLKIFKVEAIDQKRFKVIPKKGAGLQFTEIQIFVENSVVTEARMVSSVDGINILRFSDWKLR